MAVEQWASRALDQTIENPSKTIQLAAEGVIFETWGLPFPSVDEWITQARAVMASIADESPNKKRVSLLFTAVGATNGEITTQCATSVIGKNPAADAMIGAGGGTAKAFADAMVGIVATMNAVNKAAKDMLENAMRANDSLTQQIVDLREYNDALQDEVIRSKQQDSSTTDFITQQLKDATPLALEALGMFLEGHKKSTVAATAAKVVTGINQVTNGVATS